MAHMGWELENMVPAPAATATVRASFVTEDGIMECYGTTVPTDTTAGYAPGCVFQHADGAGGATRYVNEGSVTSCDFNLMITTDNINAQVAAASAPVGAGTAQTLRQTADGITSSYGTTVPVDTTAGYAVGCIFQHTDGTNGTALYVNEGSAASCDFNALTTGENLMTTITTDQITAVLNAAGLNPNVNATFGNVYWVDADTGDDSNDGLSSENAFETVGAAITANNVAFDADSDPMNTMYIHSKTYTENLTAFPKNCTVVGIGGKVRIQGYHVVDHAQNCRIHNVQFRSSTASEPILTVGSSSHGFELHKCVFEGQAAISECLLFTGNSSDIVIEECRIGYETNVANSPDIAIRFGGVANQRGKVINNQIFSTGIGIQIDATMISGNFLLIKDNVICAGNSTTDQATIGIFDKTSGPKGGIYVHNFISAADGIQFVGTSVNVTSENLCMGNWVNQAGTASWEDGGTID